MANPEPTERVMRGVSANSPLPPSVETAYYRKCIELKRRINDIEENNDTLRTRKARIERAVLKLRMERAMMLEKIGKNMELNIDDSDRSTSPPRTVSYACAFFDTARATRIPVTRHAHPPTRMFAAFNQKKHSLIQDISQQPQEKPLRSKRGHRQKATPPPSATGAAGTAVSPAAAGPSQPAYSEPINPDASANSTNTQFFNQYPNTSQVTPQSAAANPPVNGAPILPPIGSMSVTPAATTATPAAAATTTTTAAAAASSPRGYAYDPTQEERKENGDAAAAPVQQNGQAGGDVEMREADEAGTPAGSGGGFTAVNR
jgi:hypothetical protein